MQIIINNTILKEVIIVKIKKVLTIALIYSIGFGFVLVMCASAEHYDKTHKKELPATTSNSVN